MNIYEKILRSEGLLPEVTDDPSVECTLDDCEGWDGPLEQLRQLLDEWGMSPQEFELTVEQNDEALRDFLFSHIGYTN